MKEYVGCSKRDIEILIESIHFPGVRVNRVKFVKHAYARTKKKGIVYNFSKGGKKMFSIWGLPKYDDAAKPGEDWLTIEMSIICDSGVSDLVREGDDGYRKACVLYQLAEKMYAEQHKLNPAAKLKRDMITKILVRTK